MKIEDEDFTYFLDDEALNEAKWTACNHRWTDKDYEGITTKTPTMEAMSEITEEVIKTYCRTLIIQNPKLHKFLSK